MKANHAVRRISDQLFSFTEKCGEKKSQTQYPAELVPSHRVSNNSSSHASEKIICSWVFVPYKLWVCAVHIRVREFHVCASLYESVRGLPRVCACVSSCSYLSCACVRVYANCKSMSLLISIRDFALLWFGGMGGRVLEVADQDRQKSPRIPSNHPVPALVSLLCWLYRSFAHAPTMKPFS